MVLVTRWFGTGGCVTRYGYGTGVVLGKEKDVDDGTLTECLAYSSTLPCLPHSALPACLPATPCLPYCPPACRMA